MTNLADYSSNFEELTFEELSEVEGGFAFLIVGAILLVGLAVSSCVTSHEAVNAVHHAGHVQHADSTGH